MIDCRDFVLGVTHWHAADTTRFVAGGQLNPSKVWRALDPHNLRASRNLRLFPPQLSYGKWNGLFGKRGCIQFGADNLKEAVDRRADFCSPPWGESNRVRPKATATRVAK